MIVNLANSLIVNQIQTKINPSNSQDVIITIAFITNKTIISSA